MKRCHRGRRRGVNLHNLRLLGSGKLHKTADLSTSYFGSAHFLNDFFLSHNLDFLFIIETWLNIGDMAPFSELSPPDCSFLSSPRSVGRGGGLAAVFKNKFKCRLLPTEAYSSFEVQLFMLNPFRSVLCALIYRPPSYHKDFIGDFSDVLFSIFPRADNILILGDFNIHICCPIRPLVNEFNNLLDSLGLSQTQHMSMVILLT